jgi:chemotaxis protein methyltransferase CheR
VTDDAAPSPDDVQRFRSSVGRRLGLHFDEGKLGALGEVLRRRAQRAGRSCSTYLAGLEAQEGRPELRSLAEELTVTETYFFRNENQLRALAAVAFQDRAFARSGQRRLRMLSAGCASGEEAYTLAIVVRETPEAAAADVSIRGVDINPTMLDRAAQGRYAAWALRETPADIRERYFRSEGRDFILNSRVRQMVTFDERNLIEDDGALFEPGAYDIVFCRNVIMYFAPETAQAVVARLATSLVPGGYLFLGHAETLRGLSQDFHLRHTHETFYYQRREGDGPARGATAAASWSPSSGLGQPGAAPPAWAHVAASLVADDSWVETIRRASERIQLLTGAPPRGDPQPAAATSDAPGAGVAPGWDLGPALALMGQERYAEAENLLGDLPADSSRNPDVLLLRAVLLTHGGDLVAAERVCGAVLEIDDLSAGAHYLKALCREGAGDRQRAADHDQLAVYLDPSFAMPRLHLGLLARRGGDPGTARRELAEALTLLQREEPSRLLLFGGGFSRGGLLALCSAELRACGGRS